MIGKTGQEVEQEECLEMTMEREVTQNLEGERLAWMEMSMVTILVHLPEVDMCSAV